MSTPTWQGETRDQFGGPGPSPRLCAGTNAEIIAQRCQKHACSRGCICPPHSQGRLDTGFSPDPTHSSDKKETTEVKRLDTSHNDAIERGSLMIGGCDMNTCQGSSKEETGAGTEGGAHIPSPRLHTAGSLVGETRRYVSTRRALQMAVWGQ